MLRLPDPILLLLLEVYKYPNTLPILQILIILVETCLHNHLMQVKALLLAEVQ